MAKKSKKNLQKLLRKKQQLQQLGSSARFEALPEEKELTALPKESKEAPQLAAPSHYREIKSTVVSVIIIALILVGLVLFDQRSNQISQFGEWLYSALRLTN